MSTDIWTVLGITPTHDKAAIRRAYALRMREIDMETDRQAFLALRGAYEDALVYGDVARFFDDDFDEFDDAGPDQALPDAAQDHAADTNDRKNHTDAETLGPETVPRFVSLDESMQTPEARHIYEEEVPDPEDDEDDLYPQQLFINLMDELDKMVAEGGVVYAWSTFLVWMAKGDIPLGEQNEMVEAILSYAAKDKGLPREIWDQMIKVLGITNHEWRFNREAGLKETVYRRLAAYSWLDDLKSDATEKPKFRKKYQIRAAQDFLRLRKRPRRGTNYVSALSDVLATYETFKDHIPDAIDHTWHEKLNSHISRQRRRDKWHFNVLVGIIACYLVTALLHNIFSPIQRWLGH